MGKPSPRWFQLGLAAAATVLIAGVATLAFGSNAALSWLLGLRYHDVDWIRSSELANQIQPSNQPTPRLWDVRSREEYEVSHLPRAEHVSLDTVTESLTDLEPNEAVIVYCSIGLRSAIAARTLSSTGHKNVRNLRGGIFQWAKEGRPLVRQGRPVNDVHSYGFPWSMLLNAQRSGPVPREPVALHLK